MNRFIFIEDGVVRTAVTADVPETGNALVLCDLLSVFSPGDVFDREKYEAAYPDMYHPFVSANPQTLIYSPTAFIERSQLASVDLQLSLHAHIPAAYVYTSSDTQESFENLQEYGRVHSVNIPDFSLCNKGVAQQKFLEAGFTTLATIPVLSQADIEAFAFDRIILKPTVSSDTSSYGTLASVLYKICTKEQAIANLNTLNFFSNSAISQSEPIIVQQVADGENENFDALILSGCINGVGDVWHFSPIVLETKFNEQGRFVRSTWSNENNTDETTVLQSKVSTLLAGNKNCFYHLQFLKANGTWVPHDFQFRTTYYTEDGLVQTGYSAFKQDILKFVYDRSTNKPAMPCSFGLNFFRLSDGFSFSNFVSGTTRSEVLSKTSTL